MSSILIGRLMTAAWFVQPSAGAQRVRVQVARSIVWSGPGYLAGEAPADPGDPDSPDGRTRINGALASCRVQVRSGIGGVLVAETRSASDGTWRIDSLDPAAEFTVTGWDYGGVTNAAIQARIRPAVS